MSRIARPDGADGEPVNPETEIRLQVMLDDLAW
jgi:hypothetical protein